MGVGPGPDAGIANDASYWPNVSCAVGKWYTCPSQTPSFQGCCLTIDPCSGNGGTCPPANLFPAAFNITTSASSSSPSSFTQAGLSTSSSQKTTTTSTPLSPKSTVIPATTSTAVSTVITVINGQTTAAVSTVTVVNGPSTAAVDGSPTSSVAPLPSVSSTSNLPMIVGASVGGGVGAIVILALIAFFFRRCLKKKRSPAAITSDSPHPGDPFLGKSPDTPQTPFTDGKFPFSSSSKCTGLLMNYRSLLSWPTHLSCTCCRKESPSTDTRALQPRSSIISFSTPRVVE